MKRFFSCLMVSIIIIFNLFIPLNVVYASSSGGGSADDGTHSPSSHFPSNYNEMTRDEKVNYWNSNYLDTGTPNWYVYMTYNTGTGWNYLNNTLPNSPYFNWDYAKNKGAYLADNVSFDSSTGDLTNSEDLQSQINILIGNYNDESNYTEFIYPGSGYLNPAAFGEAKLYRFVKNTIDKNPNYYIKVRRGAGTENWILDCTTVPPLGGVLEKEYWNQATPKINVYTDNWDQNFSFSDGKPVELNVTCDAISGDLSVYHTDGADYGYNRPYVKIEGATESGITLSDDYAPTIGSNGYKWIMQSFAYSTFYKNSFALSRDYGLNDVILPATGEQGVMFHGSGYVVNSLPVFSNLTQLKKGTVGIKKATYLPNYTGAAPATVSDNYGNVIQNWGTINGGVNQGTGGNGTGSGSGSGDNGSSGSGWLDKIIDGLGSIGRALLNIVGVILEWVGKAIDFITESLNGIIETVTGNLFRDFLVAVFPFVPDEVWTGVMMIITLSLFGTIITFLRK